MAVPEYCFSRCDSLADVEIAEGVETVGVLAFNECSSLSRIKLPGSVRSLGASCFQLCHNLRSVRMAENCSLDDYCFSWCSNLTKVCFSEKPMSDYIQYLGEHCFDECWDLKFIRLPTIYVYPENVKESCFEGLDMENVTFAFGDNSLLSVISNTNEVRLDNVILLPHDEFWRYDEVLRNYGVDTVYVFRDAFEEARRYKNSYEASAILPIPSLSQLGITHDVSIGEGQTLQSYISSPFDYALEWTSSNEDIVKVADDGTLTAVSQGKATITVAALYDTSETATFEVTVVPEKVEPKVTALNMVFTDLSLTRKNEVDMKTYAAPIYAKAGAITKASSDMRVVTYTGETVTAKAVGTADITATLDSEPTISSICHVTVNPIPASSFRFDLDTVALRPDETYQATYRLGTYENDDYLYFTSSDENVAVVGSGGLVLAVGYGTAKIAATTALGHLSDTLVVNVVSAVPVTGITLPGTLSLKEGKTWQFSPTVAPDNAEIKTLTWESSDTAVATVDENGLCTAVRNGVAIITAKATDGSGVSASCTVTVEAIQVTGLLLSEATHTLAQGETFQLVPTIQPSDASNKTLEWTTTNANVASVDADGNVTGVSQGKAIITAKTTDGSKLSANCIVTVTEPTGIDGVVASEADGFVYYTLDGMKLGGKPQLEGIYIRVKDGQRQKVVIRR